MSKKFYVEPGYMARNGATWYDSRVMLIVEEDESVEVYTAPEGKPDARIGVYDCRQLDLVALPTGLRQAE